MQPARGDWLYIGTEAAGAYLSRNLSVPEI